MNLLFMVIGVIRIDIYALHCFTMQYTSLCFGFSVNTLDSHTIIKHKKLPDGKMYIEFLTKQVVAR
jgi:hypothetical protein